MNKKIEETEIIWNCRYHPTDWWHEVGCPHMKWTKKDLQSALESKIRFEQSKLGEIKVTTLEAKNNMDKRLLNKIVKICDYPENYVFDYINGSSLESDLRRMAEYVKCVNKVKKDYEKKKDERTNSEATRA